MKKSEFMMALLQCLNYEPDYDDSNCCGCPLKDEEGCRYILRTMVAEYFMNGEKWDEVQCQAES